MLPPGPRLSGAPGRPHRRRSREPGATTASATSPRSRPGIR